MYSTYFSFLWKQPQYKYKQYIYTYRLSFNIQHNRFNRITLLLFLVRGKQKKKKKTCHRAASRRTVKKKKNKTKQKNCAPGAIERAPMGAHDFLSRGRPPYCIILYC